MIEKTGSLPRYGRGEEIKSVPKYQAWVTGRVMATTESIMCRHSDNTDRYDLM